VKLIYVANICFSEILMVVSEINLLTNAFYELISRELDGYSS
jgi:hypothetical protein